MTLFTKQIFIEGVSVAHFDSSVQTILDAINSGGGSPGLAIPVESFNINGWEYTVNLNGELTWSFVGSSGPLKYLIDRLGNKWELNNDDNGVIVPTIISNVGGPRTFLAMILGNNVWMIGIDNNGDFEPYDLST